MLPNEQMAEGLWSALKRWQHSCIEPDRPGTYTQSPTLAECRPLAAAALAVLDRDALIDQAADALASTGLEHALRERAEVVLRAVGLLP